MKRPVVIFCHQISALSRSRGIGTPASDPLNFLKVEYPDRGADTYKIEDCDFLFVNPGNQYDVDAVVDHLKLND